MGAGGGKGEGEVLQNRVRDRFSRLSLKSPPMTNGSS